MQTVSETYIIRIGNLETMHNAARKQGGRVKERET